MINSIKSGVSKDVIIGVVITSFLFALTRKTPIVGIICIFFIPLPALYYRLKLGRSNGVLIPAITLFIMLIFLGGFTLDIITLLELLVMGFFMSECIEKALPIEKIVLYTCGAVLLAGSIGTMFFSIVTNTDIIALLKNNATKSIEASIAMYQNTDSKNPPIELTTSMIEQIHYFYIRIVPAFIVTATLLFVWITLLIARSILKQKNIIIQNFGQLNQWKAPEILIWFFIGCLLLLLTGTPFLAVVSMSGLIVLMPIYFFQGIAIVSSFFETKQFPPPLKMFLYFFLALQPILLLPVIGLGIFDIWFDFRKKMGQSSD